MKKLYQSIEQKRRNLKAQIRELNKKRPRTNKIRIRFKKTGRVKAPENFSFIENTDVALSFLTRLSNQAIMCNGKLIIDLSQIRSITVDALLLMIEQINSRNELKNTEIYCKYPDDQNVKDIILNSGFSDYVNDDLATKYKNNNSFKEFNGYERDYDFISECHKQTSLHVMGVEDCPDLELNSLLVELMDNTIKHAHETGHKSYKWWFSVYHIPDKNKTCFTFFDRGIGIMKSTNVQRMKKYLNGLTGVSEEEFIVDQILKGALKSSTNEKKRGKGLWQVTECVKSKEFSKFDLITNDKHIMFKTNSSNNINKNFNGTLYYWEFENHG